MVDEDGILGEAFLTPRALVRLLPSVCLLVGTAVGAVVEAFPTVRVGRRGGSAQCRLAGER